MTNKFRGVLVGILTEKIMNIGKQKIKTDESERFPAVSTRFPHEEQAIKTIIARLQDKINFIPNYYLHEPNNNEYLECDMVAVSRVGLFIIELKHWAGEIEILHHNWVRNQSEYWKDPHISNQYKCKVLRGLFEKEFPTIKIPFIKSLVVLTNPEATVHNADSYRTNKTSATFGGIEKLVKYFNRLFGEGSFKLNNNEVGKISEKLEKDSGKPLQKKRSIPGYEILEDLTSSGNIIEVLARQSDVNLQNIKRLRIHSFALAVSSAPFELKEMKQKALNGLHALETVGEHPNVLKVWTVHHPDGLIIEASDWSTDGTLRDVLKNQGTSMEAQNAIDIATGILTGLSVCHDRGVIHRNLKPENILMVKDAPRLINFDFAYLLEDERYTVFPDLQEMNRSPYTAPEIQMGSDFSESTDLFSVGVILYEMLCEELPFQNSLDLQTTDGGFDNHNWDQLRKKDVPDEIQILLDELIRFERNKRPGDAKEVIKILDAVFHDSSLPEKPIQNRVLDIGEVCGVYEVIGLVGQGREAQVYKAKQGIERTVVLKLFHSEIPREKASRERDNLKRIDSPYAVKAETFNQWNDGRYFLVLDFVDGIKMRDFIELQERPSLKEFRHVVHCLFSLLEEMHEDSLRSEPLLHNDIKPDNIVLMEGEAPVLIDFGISGAPRIGAYMGTPAYSAPDLLDGAEFTYSKSSDLFSLGVTLFEWFTGTRPYDKVPTLLDSPKSAESIREDIEAPLGQWLNKAVQPKQEQRFQDIFAMRVAFEPEKEQDAPDDLTEPEELRQEHLPSDITVDACKNNFVGYLNTLHNVTAKNANALAESQALNEFFSAIHVPTHTSHFIENELTKQNGHHVILTGHAGDGKSTIALELFKKLKGYDPAAPLGMPLQEIEEIRLSNGSEVQIVKDMSELAAGERMECLLEACLNENPRRWLMVSNSGTLLNVFLEVAKRLEMNELEVENRVLKALEKDVPDSLEDLDLHITIINLARVDNIQTARKLLERLATEMLWQACQACRIPEHCPIYININALRETLNNSAAKVERVYRLLYEYGHRLTIRQMSGHLAYSLTAGLECEEIIESVKSGAKQNIEEYLFFNRFFGFEGDKLDPEATRLAAIRNLLPLELGSKPYPPLERRLWAEENRVIPVVPSCLHPISERLQKLAWSGVNSASHASEQARPQLRRMFYFFSDFPSDLQQFFRHFTGSPMLLAFEKWQRDESLDRVLSEELQGKVLHVLQEHFTGMQFSENHNLHDLFITLKRSQQALRQTSQILLAKIPRDHFQIQLECINDVFGPKRYRLLLRDIYRDEQLQLDLPFLDFVMLRHEGEIGQRLNMAFLDRLDRFKGSLLVHYGPKSSDASSELEVLQQLQGDQIKIRKLFFEKDTVRVS